MQGDYDLVGAEAEVRLLRLNLFVEFGEVEEVDLALLVDHAQLHALLLEFDVKHLLRDDCLCAIRALELVDLDVYPIDAFSVGSTYLTLASSSSQEYLVIFFAGFSFGASTAVFSLTPSLTGSPP